MSRVTAYAFTFKGLDGSDILLASYAGHPILVVNTASLCGYTPQYTGLQALWTRYRDKGLMVLGVPSNDFGGQEPGGEAEIEKTAQDDYHVTFPLTEKVAVKGAGRPPVLQMGGAGAPAGGAALELPQIPDRPRRPPEGGLYLRRGAQRSAPDRGHRAGIGRRNSARSAIVDAAVTRPARRRHKSDKFRLTNQRAMTDCHD